MAKVKENSLKIVMKTEDGSKTSLEVCQMAGSHHLAIYKLIIGTYTKGQMDRIHAIMDEGK